jgi:hypothetical protein
MFGKWNVEINLNGMPQKVATAMSALSDRLIGAEYTPIAYLGSQLANGTNHAVLAEQLLTTGRDTKNIVLLIFNEKGKSCDLVNIERVVEAGGELGGTQIDVKTEIPKEAMNLFEDALAGWVGCRIEPFALLATKLVKGLDYIFITKVTPASRDYDVTVELVTVNNMTGDLSFKALL